MATKKLKIGSKVTIPAGSRVTSRGETTKRLAATEVTVRKLEFTKTGNPKVTWKSNGFMATTVLKG